ncbi:ECF RNA polymerase sigma factor SigW [Pseudidiomarina piscicola]|uniref:ECF RNA polymerase sigma factor SigW n=1 Tax=Pseudidiomarina piscicola TaxID=2614830 RepID=A0A6S6WL47_9GAMM|nr:sigma-70 family RNA polymerase sigma factor [Pseudidiomarina piscicola]CAB0150294.1 ECF RNA polymerase sigma factor SigW [Pseudidiomarina piscicola]VZT39722.1 ECF RNA polymerase sigma factor SigW [Pseudomonas aeruginosa]
MNKAEIEFWVLAFQERNKQAFDKLYRHFTPRLAHYAKARLSDASQADDVVQNVWERLAKNIHKLDDVQVFESWLYQLLRWQLMDQTKSKHLQRTLEFDEQSMGFQTVNGEQSLQVGIWALSAKLPAKEREVIELHYLYELELTSIALIVGVPTGTVKSRLYRAREQFKQLYLADIS